MTRVSPRGERLPHPTGGTVARFLSATRRVRVLPLLIGSLAAWGIASLVEWNASVFVAAVAMFAVGLLALTVIRRRDSMALRLFAIAYATRSAAALVAYFSGKGEEYWVGGVGSDAIGYYTSSFLDLGEALFEFTYKGFVTYNSYVTHWALAFDAAHYLCNLQGPVVAGAMLVVLVYATVLELRDEPTAYAAALIMALHPALISISGILLRDSLVGLFGWALLLFLIRLFRVRSVPAAVANLALAGGAVTILSFLRLQSMLVFMLFALVALYFTTRPTATHRGLPPALRRAVVILTAVAAVAGAATVLGGALPSGLNAKHFQSVVEFRMETASQGSLGVALTSGNLVVGTTIYSMLAMIAPFPFYAWSAEVLGHPTAPLDYLVGLGGMVNQLLLACSIVGFISAVRRRDIMSLAWVGCIIGFVAMTTLGGGDTVRYVAVHVFPMYLLLVIDGARQMRRRSRMLLLWLGALISLYSVYEMLKYPVDQSFLFMGIGCLLLYLGAYLCQAWMLTAPTRVAGVLHSPAPGRIDAPLAPS